MKKLTMFVLEHCPYCKQAFALHEQLFAQDPSYRDIEIEVVDEELRKDIADKYDYYYVPCYFLGEKKLFEGVPSLDIVRGVLDAAKE